MFKFVYFSDRLDNEELFTLKDRHNKMYVLGPVSTELFNILNILQFDNFVDL